MLQRAGMRPLAERIAEIERAQAGPFGVNFVPALGQGDPQEVELAASRAPRGVLLGRARPEAGRAGARWRRARRLAGRLGRGARRAADAGCDLVVAQGVEAGGHVRGTVALLPLLAGVLDAVSVPVVAAGGIASARSMAAALAAGASAVRIGTRFLATPESGAHPDYVAALLAAGAEDTVLTTTFSLGWPDAPHRVLASAVAAAEAFDRETVGTVQVNGESQTLPRFAARTPSREVGGAIEAMALYAGEGVGQVTEIAGAESLVRELSAGAETLFGAGRRTGACSAGPQTAPDRDLDRSGKRHRR